MRLSVFLITSLLTLASAAPKDSKPDPANRAQKKAAPSGKSNREAQQALTGCIDQQEGKYVLLDDRMENKLADLEAVGASNEAFFAKHLGHTVTVKGKKSAEQETKFMVSAIQDIAPVCAPAQKANPQ